MTRLFEELPATITHRAHPHQLTLVDTPRAAPFRCDGCQEPGGGGPRYSCEHCNFDLHTVCACPLATLQHPLFKDYTFVFLEKAVEPANALRCDACGDMVHGFVYQCTNEDLDLHPCCVNLKQPIFSEGGGAVELVRETSSHRHRCGYCEERCEFWSCRFRFNGENVYVDLKCLKKAACLSWEANYRRRTGADQIVHAGAPIIESALRSMSSNTRRRREFESFFRIAIDLVGSSIISAIVGNPMPLAGAIVDRYLG